MSQIAPYTFPVPGSDDWNDVYEPILDGLRTGHNSQDTALGTKVSDDELADAIQGAVDSIRQVPAGGSDGQFLGHVAGAPAWATPSGGGAYPPVGGVPKSDLAPSVQNTLTLADSALQAVPSQFVDDTELAAAIAQITAASLGAATTSQLSAVSTVANAAIPSTQKAAVNGVATLGSDGKLVAGQLPDIAIMDYLGASANQAAMLAKTGQKGDWTTRTDLGTVWIITGADPTQLASWTQLTYPTAPVTSVFGRTGAITGSPSDVGAAPLVHTHVATDITDSTTIGRSVLTAASTGAARTAIGAGTSDLALGTSSTTAKRGDYQPASTDISDASTVGKAVLVAASTTAARGAIGAGTASTKADVGLGNVANYAITPLGPADPIPGGTPIGLIIRK